MIAKEIADSLFASGKPVNGVRMAKALKACERAKVDPQDMLAHAPAHIQAQMRPPSVEPQPAGPMFGIGGPRLKMTVQITPPVNE